jgi:hypothetical protein
MLRGEGWKLGLRQPLQPYAKAVAAANKSLQQTGAAYVVAR